MIPRTPQQNGIIARRNRTQVDMIRLMNANANLAISFWEDTLLTVAYILNHVPNKSVFVTLYELWHDKKTSLVHLHLWGSTGYAHSPAYKHKKNLILELPGWCSYDISHILRVCYA